MRTLWRQWRCVVAITLLAAPGMSGNETFAQSVLNPAGTRDRREASAAPSAGTPADWRQFRGPDFGRSDETGLPLHWDDDTNIVWRTPLPGPGSSSPIVTDDRIYVTCYSGYAASPENVDGDIDDLRRHLICVDAANGDVVWDTVVIPNRPDHGYTGFLREHGYASSSPTTDGQRIYVYFGNSGAYAFDLDGHEAWHADCGERSHGFGSGASPILFEDVLIVNASVESARLFALDSRTGDEVWHVDDIIDAWNTPIVIDSGEGKELVITGRGVVRAFEPVSGRELWHWRGAVNENYICPSLSFEDDVVFGIISHSEAAAIRCGGRGDVTDSHTAWKVGHQLTVSSPVLHDGRLFAPDDSGSAVVCKNAATGKTENRIRLNPGPGRGVYASPLIADGRLYLVSRFGGVYVLRAGPELEQLAHNAFQEDQSCFNASPVPHDGRLLLRSDRFLYCIGSGS